jgi:ribonuclease BN (tRNA processing enzyme)
VAIDAGAGRLLVLDAGTGLSRLADELGSEPLRGTILLTHLHWDHTHGLPFLPNADRLDASVQVLLPRQGDEDALTLLSRAMSPPSFPITPSGLGGDWRFDTLDEGRHRVEGFEVTAAEIAHGGGRTFGYRISAGRSSLAYLPDHCPARATQVQSAAALRLAEGVDLLLHDSQFADDEHVLAEAYGHSTIGDTVAFARAAGVGRLVLFHHSPRQGDDAVAALAASIDAGDELDDRLDVHLGREGDRFDLDPNGSVSRNGRSQTEEKELT